MRGMIIMKKNLLRILMLTMVLALSLTIAVPVFASSMTGAIWSTNSLGNKITNDLFAAKADVYLKGGPANSSSTGLPAGNYYVRVTTSDGTILGKTLTASVNVGTTGRFGPVQLWSILYRASTGYTVAGYDNTTNSNGEYKVLASKNSSFPSDQTKTACFKVKPVLGTIIVKKNTTGRNDTFNFTGTGGHGLPGSFSITTSSNSGFVIYDVTPGTFGITELVGSDWILTGSNVIYASTVASTTSDASDIDGNIADCSPPNFTVCAGKTAIVTFCNKEKCTSTTHTLLSSGLINLGEGVTDKATVTGSSPKPTGTVTFQVSTDNGATFTTFGLVKTLVNGSATSDLYTPTAAGDYLFRAVYSGDTKYKASQSGAQDEPMTVNKLTSTTSTLLSENSINLAKSVTDTATVTGSSTTPTGTVTFEVSTDGGATFTPFGNIITLVSGSAISDPYTPAAAGNDYRFRAVYSGDAKYKASQSGDQEELLTVVNQATIIVVKNTDGGDAVFSFTGIGGNGLPDNFSITTSGNTGTVTYTVPAGTYGVIESVETGWELTSSGAVPNSAGDPGNFTLASGDTVTVTFNNKAKPDEPVPEVPSFLLFGLGLVGLGGLIAVKKQAKTVTNK